MHDILYIETPEDREIFGKNYLDTPKNFTDNNWHQVAYYPAQEGGQDCAVYEMRLPSRFHKIVVHPSGQNPGFVLETASNQEKLVVEIAKAVSSGLMNLAT